MAHKVKREEYKHTQGKKVKGLLKTYRKTETCVNDRQKKCEEIDSFVLTMILPYILAFMLNVSMYARLK